LRIYLADGWASIKQNLWVRSMKLIKAMILLGAVFSIAGMAFFQLFLLLVGAPFAKQSFHQHSSRQGGLTLT
jgi:hypothetical protein